MTDLEPLSEVISRYMDVDPAMALFEVKGFFRGKAKIKLEGFAILGAE